MKSVLQAGWLCTNAVGNIIVLVVAELGKLPKQVLLRVTSDLTQVTWHIRITVVWHMSWWTCVSVVCVQWAEYVLFASLLVAVSIIFSIMAYFYKYIDPAEIEAQIKREQELEPEDKREKETELNELKQTKMWTPVGSYSRIRLILLFSIYKQTVHWCACVMIWIIPLTECVCWFSAINVCVCANKQWKQIISRSYDVIQFRFIFQFNLCLRQMCTTNVKRCV